MSQRLDGGDPSDAPHEQPDDSGPWAAPACGTTRLTIKRVDPASGPARWCIARYFAELTVRFYGGFDPGASISAGDDEAAFNAEPHADHWFEKRA